MPRKRAPNDRSKPARVQAEAGQRRTLTENVDAVEWCEQQLTRNGMHPRRAAAAARKPPPEGLGMSRNTANRFVAAALERLYRDQQIEPIESKRARIIGMAQAQIELASSRTRYYVNKHGELKGYPDPDPRAALAGIELLARIELHV